MDELPGQQATLEMEVGKVLIMPWTPTKERDRDPSKCHKLGDYE